METRYLVHIKAPVKQLVGTMAVHYRYVNSPVYPQLSKAITQVFAKLIAEVAGMNNHKE